MNHIKTNNQETLEEQALNLNNTLLTANNFSFDEAISNYSIITHLNPNYDINSEVPKQSETRLKLKVNLLGDGQHIIRENMIDYFTHLKARAIVDALTISELEISPQIFEKILEILDQDLKVLIISRVPLDDEHLAIFNKCSLNLDFLSLSYIESDEAYPFSHQTMAVHVPFDVNKLQFKQLSTNLKLLKLEGVNLNKETYNTFVETYKDSLESLILEDIKSKEGKKQELYSHILSHVKNFSKLKAFSLAKNNLNSLNFGENDQEENTKTGFISKSIRFPSSLTSLNLNHCELDHKQAYDLVQVISQSKCPLKALHLQGSYMYQRNLDSFSKLVKNLGSEDKFLLETARLALDPNTTPKNPLRNSESKTQTLQPQFIDVFAHLQENSRFLKKIKNSNSNSLKWIQELKKREDFLQFFPFLLKSIQETNSILNVYILGEINFTSNPKSFIPKHDVDQLYIKIAKDLNQTLNLEDTLVGEYDVLLIRKIHPKILSDSEWAQLPLKQQRDKFFQLMKDLDFGHLEIKHQDSIEDQFIVQIRILNNVCYDYVLATFSLVWYFNQVFVRFNLSDDWYLKKSERINRYAYPNQDFMMNMCSEWNSHSNDYMFELNIPREGEAEVMFRTSIMKEGDLNVARALLIAIDKGFITLKALHKMNLFEDGNKFTGVEDYRRIRRIVKEKLKEYTKSRDFENLIRQEKTILDQDEEETAM